jgi:hypothetical protein
MLYNYITLEGIIPEEQSGFQKRRSTTSALAVVDCIRSVDENKCTILVALFQLGIVFYSY